jgi:hypothetical protein
MPLQRGAMRRDDFASGDLHAPAVQRQQLELAAVRALRVLLPYREQGMLFST